MFGADCSALFVRMRQSRTIHSSAMDSMCNIGSVLPMTKSSARPSPDALRVILAVADVLTRWCGHIVPYESSSSDWPERTVPSSFVVRLLDQHEVYPTHPSDFMKVAKRQHLRHNRNTTCLEHCDISCSILVAFHPCLRVGIRATGGTSPDVPGRGRPCIKARAACVSRMQVITPLNGFAASINHSMTPSIPEVPSRHEV